MIGKRVVAAFRAVAARCWADQPSHRPILSLIHRMRARQADRFADRLEERLKIIQALKGWP